VRRAHRLALSAVALVAAARVGTDADGALHSWLASFLAGDAEVAIGGSGGDASPGTSRVGVEIPRGVADVPRFARGTAPAMRSDADERRAERAAVDGAPVDPIVLDGAPGVFGTAVSLRGRDPHAPRSLALWRVVGDRTVEVASGASTRDGAIAFAPFVLPAGEVTLVVAPRGADPFGPSASQPVVARRDPTAPWAVSAVRGEGLLRTASLAVEPAELGGFVIVTATRNGGDAELARVAVPDDPQGGRGTLTIEVALAPEDAVLAVEHEVADGRHSPARLVPIDDLNPKENEDADLDTVYVP
jgi:hypothetical protein